MIGEDVQIRCTHNISSVINYHPWIVVDGETTTLNTLTSQENYSLNKSALIDGQVVYVVIMHNVRASDNGTRFECYFRLNGGEEIRSGTVALRVRHEGEGSHMSNVVICCRHQWASFISSNFKLDTLTHSLHQHERILTLQ